MLNLYVASVQQQTLSVYTEDNKIHCIKDGEVAVAVRDEIKTRTRALHEQSDQSDDDPFADMTDEEEELDNNELTIEDV